MSDPLVLGIVTLVTVCFNAYTAWRGKIVSEEVKKVNLEQVDKLDHITVLVNGRYGAVLDELAELRRLLRAEQDKTR